MYDLNRRASFETVGELKELLKNIHDNTQIFICGDANCWFHIEEDESVICLDNEDLDDCYDGIKCKWCGEMFDESEGRYEIGMGFLCDTCIAAIKSRGEKLSFEE